MTDRPPVRKYPRTPAATHARTEACGLVHLLWPVLYLSDRVGSLFVNYTTMVW